MVADSVRAVLCSELRAPAGAQDPLDLIGKRAGLELADISGGLNDVTYSERIAKLNPAILVGDPLLVRKLGPKAALSAALFDELRWDEGGAPIVLLGPDLQPLLATIAEARRFERLESRRARAPARARHVLGGRRRAVDVVCEHEQADRTLLVNIAADGHPVGRMAVAVERDGAIQLGLRAQHREPAFDPVFR